MALSVGAARVCLTPPLGTELQGSLTARYADNIHDDLWAQAIVVDDGERRIGFVVCDVIALLANVAEPVKARVAEECGIPPQRLLLSATHTHSGPVTMHVGHSTPPGNYLDELPQRIADAVKLACDRLRPAQMGFALGACPTEVHNRRHHMRDGSVKMNPGAMNPDIVKPAGPTDPILSVMIFRDAERAPIAVLANLSLHYVGASGLDISADYFGYFSRALQRCAGREFVAVMSNGCQGDINNCHTSRPHPASPYPYFHTERVANVVAGEAWKAWSTLWEEDYHDDVTVDGVLEMVPMQPRRPTAEQLAAAKQYLAEHQPQENFLEYFYAREHTLMEHDWPERHDFPIQALRVGEVGFVGLPAEPLVEIGLELRQRSPLAKLVPIGLANDCAGYVAPDHQMDLGGYEVDLCRHVYSPKGTVQTWVATALRLLGQLTPPA